MNERIVSLIEKHVLPKFPSDLQSFFSIAQGRKESWSLPKEAEKRAEQLIENISSEEIDKLERIFLIRQEGISFPSPSDPHPFDKDLLLPSLLVSLIQPQQELWQVTSLSFRGASFLPDSVIQRVIRQCPNIQELCLAHCQQLEPDTPLLLTKTNKATLTSLDLSSTSCSSSTLLSLLDAYPSITTLSLDHLPKILTTKFFENLHAKTPDLRYLSLKANPQIESLAFVHYFQSHPLLEKIDLNDCPQFRSATLSLLLDAIPKMRFLEIGRSEPLQEPLFYDFQAIGSFIQHHTALEELSLQHFLLRVNDIIYAYESLAHAKRRNIPLHIATNKEDIVFPPNIPMEQQKEKIEEIIQAYREINILLLMEKSR